MGLKSKDFCLICLGIGTKGLFDYLSIKDNEITEVAKKCLDVLKKFHKETAFNFSGNPIEKQLKNKPGYEQCFISNDQFWYFCYNKISKDNHIQIKISIITIKVSLAKLSKFSDLVLDFVRLFKSTKVNDRLFATVLYFSLSFSDFGRAFYI